MTAWSFTNPLLPRTSKCSLPVYKVALNYAIASALAYILRNAVLSIDCVNHYFVTKKNNTLKLLLWTRAECFWI